MFLSFFPKSSVLKNILFQFYSNIFKVYNIGVFLINIFTVVFNAERQCIYT